MQPTAVPHVGTVDPVPYHPQDDVGAGPHPAHQGGASFSHDSKEVIDSRLRKHAGCTTEAGQPHQHPERVIKLDPKGAVGPRRVIPPECASVKRGAVGSKECYLDLHYIPRKPAGDHICADRQRSTFPLNISLYLSLIPHSHLTGFYLSR